MVRFLIKDSNKIDLHIHTENSDGDYSIGEILRKAIDLKLEYIAITDHDVDAASLTLNKRILKKKYNLTVINGTELSVTFKGKHVEVLAYNYNPLLAKLVLPTFEERFAEDNPVDLKKAVKLVHLFGGVCVIAHPFKYNCDGKELLKELVAEKCVDGVECIHPYHTQEEIDYSLDVCEKNNLLVTGGSDFHYEGRKYRNGSQQNYLAELPSSSSTIEQQLERARKIYCKKR